MEEERIFQQSRIEKQDSGLRIQELVVKIPIITREA